MAIGNGDTEPDTQRSIQDENVQFQRMQGMDQTQPQNSDSIGTIAIPKKIEVPWGDEVIQEQGDLQALAELVNEALNVSTRSIIAEVGQPKQVNGTLVFEATISPFAKEAHARQDGYMVKDIYIGAESPENKAKVIVELDGATYIGQGESKVLSTSQVFVKNYLKRLNEELFAGEFKGRFDDAVENMATNFKVGINRMYYLMKDFHKNFTQWCYDQNIPQTELNNWGGIGYLAFGIMYHGQLLTVEIGTMHDSGTIGLLVKNRFGTDVINLKECFTGPEAPTDAGKPVNILREGPGINTSAGFYGTIHSGLIKDAPSPKLQALYPAEEIFNVKFTATNTQGDGAFFDTDGLDYTGKAYKTDDKTRVIAPPQNINP